MVYRTTQSIINGNAVQIDRMKSFIFFTQTLAEQIKKFIFLQCRWPINRVGCKIDPTSILAEITKSKAPIF